MTDQFNNSGMSDGFQQNGNQQNGFQQNGNQQNGFQQQGYQQGGMPPYGGYPQPTYNARLMKTNRSMIKVILLSIVTCGIYGLIFYSSLGDDINLIASRRDGKKTMHYCLVHFLLGPITCGIMILVWYHSISERIGNEARARGIATNFGASTFWLWNILGALIIVGPFIYLSKLCNVMNMVSSDYNRIGM